MLKKVISGGQTGVDSLGLQVAKTCGLETGGHCPYSFKTEEGFEPERLKAFGLVETKETSYFKRTELNILNSDGTVLYGNMASPGSKLTLEYLDIHKKPKIVNPTYPQLVDFIKENNIETLNVAGNRGSNMNQDQIISVVDSLMGAFKALEKEHQNIGE